MSHESRIKKGGEGPLRSAKRRKAFCQTQRRTGIATSSSPPSSSRPWLPSSPCESPLSGLDYARVGAASSQRTLPPGTSGCDVSHLASSAHSREARTVTPSQESSIRAKKIGVLHLSTPKVTSKNYRFFAAFFFAPLAAFFAIFFSSGCCDSASDAHSGRHNGWAEPSTLIPDVDYG